jgi:uncharacterized protein
VGVDAQPVWGEPALVLSATVDGVSSRWLVASELHVGFESDLARSGAFLKSQTPAMIERLLRLRREKDCQNLLLLGDVKNRVGGVSRQERRDVPALFDALAAFERVVVARGNHDVGLEGLLPRARFGHVEVAPASGVVLEFDEGAVGALHGHAWPKPALMAADLLLVGHTHAAAWVVDEEGRAGLEWAWARGRVSPTRAGARYGRIKGPRVIVFPPFNPLLGGAAVNREGLLGPMGRLVDRRKLELVLLDGRRVGTAGARPEG